MLNQKQIQDITKELGQLIDEVQDNVQSQLKYPKEFKQMYEENTFLGKRVDDMEEQFKVLQELNQERLKDEEAKNEALQENEKNKEELERLQVIVEEQNQVIDQYNNLLEKEKNDNSAQIEEIYQHNQQLQAQIEELVKEKDEYLHQLETCTKEIQELRDLANTYSHQHPQQ